MTAERPDYAEILERHRRPQDRDDDVTDLVKYALALEAELVVVRERAERLEQAADRFANWNEPRIVPSEEFPEVFAIVGPSGSPQWVVSVEEFAPRFLRHFPYAAALDEHTWLDPYARQLAKKPAVESLSEEKPEGKYRRRRND